ncbi:hypothetical protein [Cohnella silvisoli]|uniref:Uncharacterized protein n=1 Tax=Cohnella silvisoli TaxID=2873699 RepID=A0ABV1L2T5_9BACL|nr:hypothetical protein [Cohnella silvisoli]MCD9025881.1 hypothetical protein [Cohnella silvisoli]
MKETIFGILLSLLVTVVLFIIVSNIIAASNDLGNILAMTFVISIQISFLVGLIIYKTKKNNK